MGKHSSAVM